MEISFPFFFFFSFEREKRKKKVSENVKKDALVRKKEQIFGLSRPPVIPGNVRAGELWTRRLGWEWVCELAIYVLAGRFSSVFFCFFCFVLQTMTVFHDILLDSQAKLFPSN